MTRDKMIWLTQKLIALLFDVTVATINEHLKTIFSDRELSKVATIRNFLIVQNEGNRQVVREVEHYNLDVIIAVGYRVNSERATVFRQWATKVLSQFAQRGYVLDKKRLENGVYLSEEYFDDLISEIRDIRNSERKFYQKITDIYTTALDYEKDSELTKNFFATVQNKLHYAVHGQTAAEVIVDRASAKKEKMGLISWTKSPNGKILKSDVVVAKNYLEKNELENLNRIVSMYLDFAEDQAVQKIPMTMQDWATRLNEFLKFNRREILDNPGKVSAEVAKSFAETEFEKYKIKQDKIYKSDFDLFLEAVQNASKKDIINKRKNT
jgi:hypothetical protein